MTWHGVNVHDMSAPCQGHYLQTLSKAGFSIDRGIADIVAFTRISTLLAYV